MPGDEWESQVEDDYRVQLSRVGRKWLEDTIEEMGGRKEEAEKDVSAENNFLAHMKYSKEDEKSIEKDIEGLMEEVKAFTEQKGGIEERHRAIQSDRTRLFMEFFERFRTVLQSTYKVLT